MTSNTHDQSGYSLAALGHEPSSVLLKEPLGANLFYDTFSANRCTTSGHAASDLQPKCALGGQSLVVGSRGFAIITSKEPFDITMMNRRGVDYGRPVSRSRARQKLCLPRWSHFPMVPTAIYSDVTSARHTRFQYRSIDICSCKTTGRRAHHHAISLEQSIASPNPGLGHLRSRNVIGSIYCSHAFLVPEASPFPYLSRVSGTFDSIGIEAGIDVCSQVQMVHLHECRCTWPTSCPANHFIAHFTCSEELLSVSQRLHL